jgi:carbamoyltransferase
MIGFSEGFHDAAVAVINDGTICYAAHSERYSKRKHDKHLDITAASTAQLLCHDGTIAFYERPLLKRTRQFFAGQKSWYRHRHLSLKPTEYHSHHKSHAAAAFQTSPFDEAAIVVVDSIGEWDTTSIWTAEYGDYGKAVYKKRWSQWYPHSIGLWYSALTKWAGLRPLDEEYIFMGMAAYGNPVHMNVVERQLHKNNHKGARIGDYDKCDIAKSAERILQLELNNIFARASTYSKNICYGGGVALNCVVNTGLREMYNLWIMPCPGDAGGALGAACLAYGGKVDFSPYLGYNIQKLCDPRRVVDELLKKRVVGVANGRAEFGPRALGNRSLLADPRQASTKDLVNEIKRRDKFRPFAPAVLEEHCQDYFDMPSSSRYMSYVYKCKQPKAIPACVHVDNSARVQTVPKESVSILRPILEAWYARTGCPVLLNTSLNIKGKPMVNTIGDAMQFSHKYGVTVL